jgi:hypothetical protein
MGAFFSTTDDQDEINRPNILFGVFSWGRSVGVDVKESGIHLFADDSTKWKFREWTEEGFKEING